MIDIKGVSKKLGDNQVLKDIELHVEKGSIFGLIGPNGAGKTTLMKLMTGIYKADCGEILVNGNYVYENIENKARIGYVADENNYFTNFTVKNIKKFYQLSYKSFNNERFERINRLFNIPMKLSVKKLSKGMKTKLAVMLNLSIMPDVLIMDEPTSGLDPIVKRQMLNLILDDVAERQTTVLISSHNLSELEKICDSIAILNNGKIAYTNSLEDMKRKIRRIQLVFKNDIPADIDIWNDIVSRTMKVEKAGRVYNIITRDYSEDLKGRLSEAGVLFQEEIDLSLEDMFIYSVGGEDIYEEVFK